MPAASLLLPALVLTASLVTQGSYAPSFLTVKRSYQCLRIVYRGQSSFNIEHGVYVMSDGRVVSRCALSGALQGSASSVFPRTHLQAAAAPCTVEASDGDTPTGESWTLELMTTKAYSLGTFHARGSPQEGLVYSLACRTN